MWKSRMMAALNPPNGDAPEYEKAQTIKSAEMPKSMFRLRSLTHNNIEAFINDTIWLPHAGSFNDPFDSAYALSAERIINTHGGDALLQVLDDPKSEDFYSMVEKDRIKSASEPLAEAIEIFIARSGGVPLDAKSDIRSKVYASAQAMLQASLSNIISRSQRSVRVACFSETINSIVMWSHYADYHRGFALEYQLKPVLKKELNLQLWPIIYSENLYDGTQHLLKGFDVKMISHLPLIAALHKSPEWEYEREWRLVVPLGETEEPIIFRNAKPIAIYLGARIPDDSANLLQEEAVKKDINIFKMQLAHDRFSLTSTVDPYTQHHRAKM